MFPNPTLAQTPLFNPQTEYLAGTNTGPSSIVVADFNGDGKPDLAVANFSDFNVYVLLGNGDGTFQPARSVYFAAGGARFWSLAAGDFNGDGKLDLAVTDYANNTVTVLLGNGDGTFQTPRTFPVGTNPGKVAVGDFNGDGKPDLAVSNVGSNTVSVLLGNGDGTFQPALNFPVGLNPWYFAVGDFNGDGKLDLAVADYGCPTDCASSPSNTVMVLLGNGDGTFLPAPSLAVGNGPAGVAVGDFNGDGKPDLAVANFNDSTLSVLLGNGDGTFQAARTFGGVGTHPQSVAVGDFNRDGKLDLVVTNSASNTVSVLLGNGDGTFQPAQNFAVDSDPVYVTVGDFNGDRVQDLAVANLHSIMISVLLGNSGIGVPPVLSGLSLNPSSVTGGSTSTGTVTLSGPAPSGGAVVGLSSSNTSVATVPSSVTVPGGSTSATFPVSTNPVSSSTSVTISASYGGTTLTASLTVNPAAVPPSITSQPASQSVTAGQTATFSVTASGTAPLSYQWSKNGTPISGATSSSYTTPPTTPLDNGAQFVVVVSNTAGSATSNPATLTVTALLPTVASLTLSPSGVTGGSPSTGTVTLSGPAPSGGAVVSLSSSNPPVASVPASVTVPAGATSASFTVTTTAVATSTPVTISGSYSGSTQAASLTVTPPTLTSLTLSPSSVVGGPLGSSTGTVTLSAPAPAGGAQVVLSSSDPSVATVPASVTVPAGATSATFTVNTSVVVVSTTVTISGSYNNTTQVATLTVIL